ncbi:MAG: hypothetical protein WDO06_01050 [Actinomycetota bacterium]
MTSPELVSERFFFNPIRNAFIWAFIGTHLLVAIVLGRVFAFSPDERTYLSISHKVYTSEFEMSSEVGWKDSQKNYIRILYLPARLLEAVGVPDYIAIRIVSIGLSTVVLYLLLCLAQQKLSKRAIVSLVAAFLIPSVFMWMTLGLREPYLFLAGALICAGTYLLGKTRLRTSLVFISLGCLIALETKPIIFLITLGALGLVLIFMVWRSRGVNSHHGLIVLAIAIPMLIDLHGSVGLAKTIHQELFSISETGVTTISSYADRSAQAAAETNFSTTSEFLKKVLEEDSNTLFVKILKFVHLDKRLLAHSSDTNDESYNSAAATRLNVSPASVRKPITVIKRTGAFLFTPFPLIDNGSLFLNILSFESPLWWIIFVAFGIAIWRRFLFRRFDELTVFVLSFLLFSYSSVRLRRSMLELFCATDRFFSFQCSS